MDAQLMQIVTSKSFSAFSPVSDSTNADFFRLDRPVDLDSYREESTSNECSDASLASPAKGGMNTFNDQNTSPLPLYKLVSNLSGSGSHKRVYFCQRCLNHGRHEPRKNHKCECPFANCSCEKVEKTLLCYLVEKRRVLNTQLHELEEVAELCESDNLDELQVGAGGRIKGERVPNCQKCGQHGRKNRLKGHKRVCPFKDCACPKCQVVTERQKLMADQIKIRRRQRKDTLMSLTRENLTATLNAAAAVAAGQINFSNINFNNINAALLYGQMNACSGQNGLSRSPTNSSESSAYSPPATSVPQLIPAPVPTTTAADLSSILFNATNSENCLANIRISDSFRLPTTLSTSLASSVIMTPTSLSGGDLGSEPMLTDSIAPPSGLPAPTPIIHFPTTLMSSSVGVSSEPTPNTPTTPTTSGILAPVALNPGTSAAPPLTFQFPLLSNEQILQQLLENYKQLLLNEQVNGTGALLEKSVGDVDMTPIGESVQTSNNIIDVCSV